MQKFHGHDMKGFYFQTVLKILNKPNSVMGWGTYASNAVVSGNSNGLLDVMDDYDKVKDFFAINLYAFVIAASLKYFGVDNIDSQPTINNFEPALKSATKTDKRQWLHKQVSNMVVMDGVSDLQSIHNELASPSPLRTEHRFRHLSCDKKFVYDKCLARHELHVHGLELPSPVIAPEHSFDSKEKERVDADGIYECGCLTLSLGLLLRDADYAVKEGDGERLSRV